MSSVYLAHVVYSPGFERMDTWFLDPDGARVRVRFRCASGPEIVHDVLLADNQLRAISGDDWKAGPMTVPGTLGRIEFVLRGAPEHVTAALRAALPAKT